MLIKFPDRISQDILHNNIGTFFYMETIITSGFQTICLLSIKLPNKLKREVSSQLNVTEVGDRHGGLRLNSQFDCKAVLLCCHDDRRSCFPRRVVRITS